MVSAVLFFLLAIAQIVFLIRYTEQTNRKLKIFFESIRHSDFTTSFTGDEQGKSFEELNSELNAVIEAFKRNKTEKEEHLNYLLTVVQHVSMGILVYKTDGTVDVYNNAVKKLLQVKHLRNIGELAAVQEKLPETLLSMKPGEKKLIKLFVDDELLQVSVHATGFMMHGEKYLLVSLQDIHPELEQKEIESWQKLIRVLTHEIMNSITPISSLASTVTDILSNYQDEDAALTKDAKEDIENVKHALSTIEKRSKGLMNFVDEYRNLTRIPKPKFQYFSVNQLFVRLQELMTPKIEKQKVKFIYNVYPADLKLLADPTLTEQVMINLLLNALDALDGEKNPKITLTASMNLNNRTIIEVSDNGKGISPDIVDKIFMPFFTSKKSGSGIGLSLSRQIMQMHKGSISVRSKQGEGSSFMLVF